MKNKSALIIGYGSAGKRHASLLKKNKFVSKIYVLTKQKCNDFIKISNISEIKKIDPYLIIISSRTSEHFKHLLYIEKNFNKKIVLVEKPLFEKFKKINIKKNKIYIGYNLRLHPIINFVKKFIKRKKIFSTNIYCHSYLPNWRKNINYKKSNSANKKFGGGVLLELSHELDYLEWIFDKIIKINQVSIGKISNLKVNTEDFALITGRTKKVNFTIDLNYFSLNTQRMIIINGQNFSLKCDLIKNFVEIITENKKKVVKFNVKKDFTYNLQLKKMLSENFENLCNYKEGLKVLKVIDDVRKFNKYGKK